MDKKTTQNDNLKVIISPVVASELCTRGHKIVKLKPKHNTNGKEMVFLFEISNDFMNDFYEIVKKYKNGECQI